MIGITGYKGVLGAIICKKLGDRNEMFSVFEGDIRDFDSLYNWLQFNNIDYVIHLASKVAVTDVENNLKFKENFIMKLNITFTILFMFSFLFVKGQQATNTAGNHYSSGDNVLTFSTGEFVNEQFNSSNFSLKAGVIQSFSAACPIPSTFAFQQLNSPCIPEGGAVSLALSGSEPNVRYQIGRAHV